MYTLYFLIVTALDVAQRRTSVCRHANSYLGTHSPTSSKHGGIEALRSTLILSPHSRYSRGASTLYVLAYDNYLLVESRMNFIGVHNGSRAFDRTVVRSLHT